MIIGVGNSGCGDDAAGIEVARRVAALAPPRLRVVVHDSGELSLLVDEWREAGTAIVVDAASTGAEPGSVHRFDAISQPLPQRALRTSTHAFGLAEAVELARALDRLPSTLEVWAIEGRHFAAGDPLSGEVERAVERLVEELRSG